MDWFDELPLDPTTHPVSMGTHALGDRPWLVFDDRFDDEIAEKRWSLEHRRDEVAWFTSESRGPAERVIELFTEAGVSVDRSNAHPLEDAALAVQDDLCLLRRIDDRWHFDASVICFPTYWDLQSKVGLPMGAVHDPVPEYHDRIASKVTRLFDRVGDRPVLRRNLVLADNRELFQPSRRAYEPNLPADRVMDELILRTERQSLRSIADDWLLFGIRIQMASLSELLTTPERTTHFRRWVSKVPTELAAARHLSETQRATLLQVLAA